MLKGCQEKNGHIVYRGVSSLELFWGISLDLYLAEMTKKPKNDAYNAEVI